MSLSGSFTILVLIPFEINHSQIFMESFIASLSRATITFGGLRISIFSFRRGWTILPNSGMALKRAEMASNTPSTSVIGSFQFMRDSNPTTSLLTGGFLYFAFTSSKIVRETKKFRFRLSSYDGTIILPP